MFSPDRVLLSCVLKAISPSADQQFTLCVISPMHKVRMQTLWESQFYYKRSNKQGTVTVRLDSRVKSLNHISCYKTLWCAGWTDWLFCFR